ncbi:hypothetical protein [Microbacterium phage MO526]|uniref:Acb2/Tad1 hairpin domain-containing protein n=1 Tax=Microbacterium phage MO526 TaxID=3108092 RepID=A0ABZ0ZX36_9CAUD|nr:hypothetical protein [Microbacterium phage MO526]
MALLPDNTPTRLSADDIAARLGIAQHGNPTDAQLREQAEIAAQFADLADRINRNVADSRPKSEALTLLEDALMWTGKAIFAPAGIR